MKLLSLGVASLLLSASLLANESLDKKVIAFEKEQFLQNQNIKLTNVDIVQKEALPIKGWYGYVLNIQANVPNRGLVSVKDMVFSNGEAFTMELLNMNTGQSFKNLLMPKVTKAYYKKSHLIAGDENAKNKVVVFSDPLCPACQRALPAIIDIAKDKSKNIALYYYHFPLLTIHPAADVLSRAMIIAKQKGVQNIEEKVYKTNFNKYFNARQTNSKIILDGFNKIFKTNITIDEINQLKIKQEMSQDVKMGEDVMVQGTPTIFVNGINDRNRSLFQKLAK